GTVVLPERPVSNDEHQHLGAGDGHVPQVLIPVEEPQSARRHALGGHQGEDHRVAFPPWKVCTVPTRTRPASSLSIAVIRSACALEIPVSLTSYGGGLCGIGAIPREGPGDIHILNKWCASRCARSSLGVEICDGSTLRGSLVN